MYYLIFGGILFALIIITWSYYMNNKEAIVNDTKKNMNLAMNELISKKEFPLWQRFVYCVYCILLFGAFVILPFVLAIIVTKYNYDFYIPKNAIYGNVYWDISKLMDDVKSINYFFSFIAGMVPILFILDYLFNRGFVKKIDDVSGKISIKNYGKQENTFGILIFIIICVTIIGLNFNSYQYCTKDEIVVKKFYKIKENRYDYEDIEKVVKELYNSDNGRIPYHYVAYFKNGDKLTLAVSKNIEVKNIEKILEDRIIYVEIDDSRIY